MRYFLACLFFVVFFSCNKPIRQNNEITKIELARGGDNGHSSQSVISIDSDLTVKYYGDKNSKLKGYFSGKIVQSVWDTLNKKLSYIHYTGRNYETGYRNDQSIELFIHYKYKTLHIETTMRDLPDNVNKTCHWIETLVKSIKFTQVKDSIKFETTLQYEKPLLAPKF